MDEIRPGHLVAHILAFGHLLREMGVPVSPGQMLDLLGALDHITIASREDLRAAMRCLLILRHEDLPLFDLAFALYWLPAPGANPRDQLHQLSIAQLSAPRRRLRLRQRQPEGAQPAGEEREELELQLTFSRDELLRRKDFAQCSWEELQAAKELMRRVRWRIEARRTRRRRPARRGRTLDFRRTLRRSLRYGGLPLQLARREPQTRPRPLVIICDISGSMERYARILLQFAYAITAGLDAVEAFVFGTRLTRITRQLRHSDIDEAIDRVSRHVVDWSGGTRIGAAIKEFNFRWGRRVLGHGPVVLLISDGWDRGEPELLRREMDRLQRSCHRLIWLNPLLGSPGYEPLTIGMQAALPFVDDFLPVHNLISLEQLARRLATLSARPPARRQRPLSRPGL